MIFFERNFSLTALNTFGIEATAPFFGRYSSVGELVTLLDRAESEGLDVRLLGGGSNTIFLASFAGAVLQSTDTTIERHGHTVVAGAGVVWDDLVAWSVAQGLQGLENLSAIPGSVGASPVQNIGAYGLEAGDAIEWVEFFNPQNQQTERIAGADCAFGYRESIFKKELKGCVVLRVAYRLNAVPIAGDYSLDYGDLRCRVEASGAPTPTSVRAAVAAIRTEKLPDPAVLGNAGSFFKNPVVSVAQFEALKQQYPDIASYPVADGVKVPAGWLIDRAGWKGRREGRVGVHERQALVLVNHGGATGEEILNFAAQIEADVRQKYGIALEKEVTVV